MGEKRNWGDPHEMHELVSAITAAAIQLDQHREALVKRNTLTAMKVVRAADVDHMGLVLRETRILCRVVRRAVEVFEGLGQSPLWDVMNDYREADDDTRRKATAATIATVIT